MLNWFTEDSTLPMITGVILVLIFLGFAFSAREKTMVYVAIVIAVLTVGTVMCERWIVTDQEQVMTCVHELADAVHANNKAGVLSLISPSRQDTIARVNAEMPRYDFDTCRVIGTNYFTPSENGGKQTAEICFIVTFRVRLDGGSDLIPGHRKIILQFEKQADGKWRVIDYAHADPRQGVTI